MTTLDELERAAYLRNDKSTPNLIAVLEIQADEAQEQIVVLSNDLAYSDGCAAGCEDAQSD